MTKQTPRLVTDDYVPSDGLLDWCKKTGVSEKMMLSVKDDLIFYCSSTNKKYKDHDMTLRNWIKNELKKTDKQEEQTKKGSGSYKSYEKQKPVTRNKSLGREALNKLRGKS